MKGLLVRVFAAFAVCFLFSQSAEFTQQYLQRLGGAADALRDVVARFDTSASTSRLSRQEAVAQLKRNPDAFVARQGADAAETILRFDAMQTRYRQLASSAPLLRPFVALADPDWTIADRARADYRPALPITIDGLVLAIAGFVLGWAGGSMAYGAIRMGRRRRVREGEAQLG